MVKSAFTNEYILGTIHLEKSEIPIINLELLIGNKKSELQDSNAKCEYLEIEINKITLAIAVHKTIGISTITTSELTDPLNAPKDEYLQYASRYFYQSKNRDIIIVDLFSLASWDKLLLTLNSTLAVIKADEVSTLSRTDKKLMTEEFLIIKNQHDFAFKIKELKHVVQYQDYKNDLLWNNNEPETFGYMVFDKISKKIPVISLNFLIGLAQSESIQSTHQKIIIFSNNDNPFAVIVDQITRIDFFSQESLNLAKTNFHEKNLDFDSNLYFKVRSNTQQEYTFGLLNTEYFVNQINKYLVPVDSTI